MGLTLISFLIALTIYIGGIQLGNFISDKYSPEHRFVAAIQSGSIFLAFVGFFWTFLAFLRSTVSEIKQLSSNLKLVTEGNLDLEISLERKDELGSLASDIDIMRKSLINRMEKEKQAIKSNQELITSLSHDLRNPLTKQMCAIELALKKDCADNEETQQILKILYRYSQQIKDISDELFSYFLVGDIHNQPKINFESYNANTLFAQILSEYSDLLESSGFRTELIQTPNDNYFICVDVSYIMRIMDNLVSNIRKYADNTKIVKIEYISEIEYSKIILTNTIHFDDGKLMDSSNIGLNSAKHLAEILGGELHTVFHDKIFTATLKIIHHNEI